MRTVIAVERSMDAVYLVLILLFGASLFALGAACRKLERRRER
jgi:hypothetical protein